MSYLVISTSLNPESRSRLLAEMAFQVFKEEGESNDWLDLAEFSLPFCDGGKVYEDPTVKDVSRRVENADGILLATPIYNYDANACAKNLIELTGRAWTEKVVGFLCAAGGEGSYMSIMGIANSLMLDYRCLIIPRFVYATGEAFEGKSIVDPEIRNRISGLAKELERLCRALKNS